MRCPKTRSATSKQSSRVSFDLTVLVIGPAADEAQARAVLGSTPGGQADPRPQNDAVYLPE